MDRIAPIRSIGAAGPRAEHERTATETLGVHRIRVVLAEMPRMLRDIVQTILAAQPDVALATAHGGATLAETLGTLDAADAPDVVILAEPLPNAEDYASVLYARPRLRLVGISSDGRNAHLYELRPQRIALGALSPDTLVDVVRAAQVAAHERD